MRGAGHGQAGACERDVGEYWGAVCAGCGGGGRAGWRDAEVGGGGGAGGGCFEGGIGGWGGGGGGGGCGVDLEEGGLGGRG